MPASQTLVRLAAAFAAAALLSACGMWESVSLDPDKAPARPAASAPAPAPAIALPGQPAQCVPEGGSCRAKSDTCCGGLVCAGIGASFCMTIN